MIYRVELQLKLRLTVQIDLKLPEIFVLYASTENAILNFVLNIFHLRLHGFLKNTVITVWRSFY